MFFILVAHLHVCGFSIPFVDSFPLPLPFPFPLLFLVCLCVSMNIPHLLFCGPSCTGKKTRLFAMLRAIYTRDTDMRRYVMIVNCAHNKGIGFVRNDIKYFAQTAIIDVPFKSVVLLNADHLSVDAQSALRRCMEQFSHTTRFFGVANDRNRLICPILSRFSVVGTGDLPFPLLGSLLEPHPVSIEVDLFAQSTVDSAYIQNIMGEINSETTDVCLMAVADDIYNSGISSGLLVDWIRTRRNDTGVHISGVVDMCLTIESERQNYRNDQLFLLRIIDLYRRLLA